MEKEIVCAGARVNLIVTDHGTVILGLNGKTTNPDRHATGLTQDEARKLAKWLIAAADLAQ